MHPLIIIIVAVAILFALKKLPRKFTLKYGNKYIKKFHLNFKEISHLNSINIPWENFVFIDFCAEEVLRLYIETIRNFPELLVKKILKREQNLTLKYCIWQVQYKYNYKISKLKMPEELINDIPSGIKTFVDSLTETIPALNEKQEKKLCTYDSTRWRRKFDQLTDTYKGNAGEFYNEILNLASDFSYISTIRAIYHKAHQFMADKNKEISAKLYIHYLSIKSESETFKFTGINAKNKKLLFSGKNQEAEFEQIIEKFKTDNDLEKALNATKELLAFKRKTIHLDVIDINKAQQEYDVAVGILNEYLIDEEIPESVIKSSPLPENSNSQKNYPEKFLELFISNDYKLDKKEVDEFAEKEGTFASQLVNNINETYYDELNDVLIEEEDGCFVVNKVYCEKIQ